MRKEHSHPIISSTKNLPLIIRIRDVILTILVWVLYFYFMRDFLSFAEDLLTWTSEGFTDADEYYSFRILSTLLSYFEVIILMAVLYVLWSFYNMARYGKKQRRRVQPPVNKEELAKAFHVSLTDVGAWQKAQTMVMHHDRRGRLTEVQVS